MAGVFSPVFDVPAQTVERPAEAPPLHPARAANQPDRQDVVEAPSFRRRASSAAPHHVSPYATRKPIGASLRILSRIACGPPLALRQRVTLTAPLRRLVFIAVATLLWPLAVEAQDSTTPPASPPAPPAAQAPDEDEDDPGVLNPAEPDFVVVNLPTNLRLPRFKGNFRMTHRFVGNLLNRSFAENAADLFGLDQGAIIGFEYRMNVMRDVQVAAFRTNFDKTIMLYGKYDGIRQRGAMPVSVSGLLSIEGTNNFQEKFAPAVGLIVSRRLGNRVAMYVSPIWVGHTNASLAPIDHDHGGEVEEHEHDDALDTPPHDRQNTMLVGLAARLRLTSTLYAVGEMTPRVSGYAPNKVEYGFGIEKRVGGHAFSLTFTNTFGTTFSQLARGGPANVLYLGFNLGRKFY